MQHLNGMRRQVQMISRGLIPSIVLFAVTTIWLAASFAAVAANGQAVSQNRAKSGAKPESGQGRQIFASTCGGCHGLDGKGGERAPNIADRPNVQRLSDAQISHIVENGIPGTGMPAFHALAAPQVKRIVAYLRTLQGTKQTTSLPGNPDHGKALFFGKAKCSECHMAAGEGGFIASDLSEYGRTHDLDETRLAILDSTKSRNGQLSLVTATARDGQEFIGRVRNEDNFSLQLQTLDGTFQFFSKSDLKSVEAQAEPLMPSNFRSTLSPGELNDVMSFMMKLAGADGTASSKKGKDWDE